MLEFQEFKNLWSKHLNFSFYKQVNETNEQHSM